MKRFSLMAAAGLALLAAPALADESPAEIFGAQGAGAIASPAAMDKAMANFENESPAERTMRPEEFPTRGISIGDRQLAAALGVDAQDFTSAELSKMYIGKYD
ncbi:hypothetical protein [Litoreibacter ponti]|nr:hypothetical protein [Litoreibacter ponti]